MKNEEVLHRVEEDRNDLHTLKTRKGSSISHILSGNCLLKHSIQRKKKKDRSDRKTKKK